MEKEDIELINTKSDNCDECIFARDETCPTWAMDECSGTNKVWKLKKSDKSELTTGQTIGYGILGCLAIVIGLLVTFSVNVILTAWALKYFFHM